MPPKDVHHLRPVRGATGGRPDDLGRFTEVCRPHDGRSYEGELFRIPGPIIVEAVHRPSLDTECLPGANLDWVSVYRPGENTLNSVEDLLVGIVLVVRCRLFLPGRNENLEHRRVTVGIITGEEKPDS